MSSIQARWKQLSLTLRTVAAWAAGVAAAVGATVAAVDSSGILPGLHLPAQAVAVLTGVPAVLAGVAAALRSRKGALTVTVHMVSDVERLASELAPHLRALWLAEQRLTSSKKTPAKAAAKPPAKTAAAKKG